MASDHFNRLFIEKPSEINKNIPPSSARLQDLVPINNKSFRMMPITTSDVSRTISKLKNGGGLVLIVRFLKMFREQVD